MMTEFPKKIKFLSDGSEVKLVGEISAKAKEKTNRQAEYKFTKVDKRSQNKGKCFPMSLDQINTLNQDKLIFIKAK